MAAERRRELKTIHGLRMDIERVGAGRPLLLLLSEEASRERVSSIVEMLARRHEVVIPYAPGFGRSERPDWISTPDDIAYMMLDVVEELGLAAIPVVGVSLGGWIALQMAIKDDSFIRGLILVDPYGVKLSGPYERDIQDIWSLRPEHVSTLKWLDPEAARRDYRTMPDDEVETIARESESFARFCWDPYMHDPKLKFLLHRVRVPTLFVWGEKDGVTPPEYGRAFSRLIAGARFVEIRNAAHYPHIEQPEAVLSEIYSFLK